MQLRVVTPLRPILDTEVTEVVVPGEEGEFGVLSQHVTFLAALKPGIVTFTEGGTKKQLVISGGYAEVRQDFITLLADEAELPEEVDAAGARTSLASIQEELARGSADPKVTQRLLRDQALAEARLSIGTRQ